MPFDGWLLGLKREIGCIPGHGLAGQFWGHFANRGAKREAMACFTLLPAHFAESLCNVFPTAVSLTLPLFFVRVISEAPKNKGRVVGTIQPLSTKLTN